MVHCFDENVKILGPKSFEVEKRNKNEETKMSIHRLKRRAAGCTVRTIVTPGELEDLHVHRHHQHHDPPPRNFNTKTSYSVSKSVTSPPVERNFNTRHSSSSDSEISSRDHETDHPRSPSYPIAEELPTIPHLPDIPHIGHEGTYPNPRNAVIPPSENGHAPDTTFGAEEPGPGEKTITFKTNTHRHEMVDQTGFVREKVNGYPIRPNEEWRSRFKDMPYMLDENGRIISSAASSLLGFGFTIGEMMFVLLVQYAFSVLLTF